MPEIKSLLTTIMKRRPESAYKSVFARKNRPEVCKAFFSIQDVPFADDVDMDHVIGATDGLSFAELSGLLREAALQALRRDSTAIEVTMDDIQGALERYTADD